MPSSELKLRFDAVYYHVTDMERAIAFYRDTLGLRLTSRDHVARFDIDGVLFELVPNAPANVLPGTGNARLSLGVTDIQQVTEGAIASLIASAAQPGVWHWIHQTLNSFPK